MISWLPWSADAFARAAREGKPVLLSITAAWCHACHEMDRTTYADPAVAAIVRDRFVAIRVDTDRRPDINERYNLGGWPTTAFLTAAGELVTGGTFVPADRMVGVLTRVSAAAAAGWSRPSPSTEAAATRLGAATSLAPGLGQIELIESIFATFDEDHGGFGVEPKFPHAAPIHLAIALFRDSGDERWRTIAERSLDAMAAGELWDPGGGFFRYSVGRDWRLPHREKLLETNADLLRVYAEAALVFGRQVDRDRCAALSAFITRDLRAEAGGYRGSDAERMPGVLYMDGNAKAAGALLGAATVLDDSALAREALASFERVILLCYKPAAGLAHYSDGVARVRGLAADQIYTVAALLDAYDVSTLEPYRMMAEELVRVALHELWDEAAGGFFDRTPNDAADIGLLRMRRKPFVLNAEAAATLARLERACGEAEFRARAEGALGAAAAELAGQGPLAAHYVLAARLLSAR